MARDRFRKSCVVLAAATTLLGAAVLTGQAMAQQLPGSGQGRPGSTPVTGQVDAPRPGSTAIQLPEPAPLRIVPFRVAPIITVDPSILADMSGWTRLTEGASKGAVALTRLGDAAYLVAVGQDDTAYAAPVSISSLALDATAWTAIGAVGRPGITCISTPSLSGMGAWELASCYALTASGGARRLRLGTSDGQSALYGAVSELGGSNAANVPLGISFNAGKGHPTPQLVNANDVVSVVTVMADNGLWRLVQKVTGWNTAGMGSGYIAAVMSASWERLDGLDAISAAACSGGNDRVFCVFSASGGRVRMVDQQAAGGSAAPGGLATNHAWNNAVVSPPAPGGAVTSAPALVRHPSGRITIVVRGATGRLLRIVYTSSNRTWSGWSEVGGFLRPQTQPSCIADGEVPVCAIQGADGAGYARRLPPAQGI